MTKDTNYTETNQKWRVHPDINNLAVGAHVGTFSPNCWYQGAHGKIVDLRVHTVGAHSRGRLRSIKSPRVHPDINKKPPYQ